MNRWWYININTLNTNVFISTYNEYTSYMGQGKVLFAFVQLRVVESPTLIIAYFSRFRFNMSPAYIWRWNIKTSWSIVKYSRICIRNQTPRSSNNARELWNVELSGGLVLLWWKMRRVRFFIAILLLLYIF